MKSSKLKPRYINNSSKVILDQAWDLFRKNKLDDAFLAFERITDIHFLRDATYGKARCLEAMGRYHEALAIFDIAPNNRTFQLGKARCLQEIGLYDDALIIYNTFSSDKTFQLSKARCLEAMRRYHEALAIFDTAPNNRTFRLSKARCLRKMGRYHEALVIFDTAPNDETFQLGKARCLQEMGRCYEALAIFDTAPNDRTFQLGKACCLQEMGLYDDALVIYNTFPNDREFQLSKTRCLEEMGRYHEALAIFDTAPNNRTFQLGKARCLEAMGQYHEALAIFDTAPNNRTFQLSKARCLERMEQYHKALVIYDKFHYDVKFRLGKVRCLEKQREYKEAQEIYESYYLQNNEIDYSYCLFLLNQCLLDDKQQQAFLKVLEGVKTRYPYNTVFPLLEAQYLRKIGDLKQSNTLLSDTQMRFPYCRTIYIERIINHLYEQQFDLADTVFSEFKTCFLHDYKKMNKIIGLFFRYGIYKNVQEKQEETKPVHIVEEICRRITTIIEKKGHNIYLTGGGARFLLLIYHKQITNTPHDLDFVTDAPIELIQMLFPCYIDSHVKNLYRFSKNGIDIDILCLDKSVLIRKINQSQSTVCNYDQIYGRYDQIRSEMVIFAPEQDSNIRSFLKREPPCILEIKLSFQDDPVRILKFLKLCALYSLPIKKEDEEVIIACKYLLRKLPVGIIHSQLHRLFINSESDCSLFFNILLKYTLFDDLFNSDGITQYLEDDTIFTTWLMEKIIKIAEIKTMPSHEKLRIIYELFMLATLLFNISDMKEFPLILFEQEYNRWKIYFPRKKIHEVKESMHIIWRTWQIFKLRQLEQPQNTFISEGIPINGKGEIGLVGHNDDIVSPKPKHRKKRGIMREMWQRLSQPYRNTTRPDELYRAQSIFEQVWKMLPSHGNESGMVEKIFAEKLAQAYYRKTTELLSFRSFSAFFKFQPCCYGFRLDENSYYKEIAFTQNNLLVALDVVRHASVSTGVLPSLRIK